MVIYHPLVRRDLRGILDYYAEEGGEALADRFFETFLRCAKQADEYPTRNHPVTSGSVFRRAGLTGFPYHFLYRETSYGIRISVLRHDKRRSDFGMRRR